MFNEMICSRCKSVVSITATTIELPFLCEECVEADSREQSEPEAFYHLGIPDTRPLAEILETEAGNGTWTSADQKTEISFSTPIITKEEAQELESHGTATVENTTLLIADLEQQVAGSKEALDKSNELIADLTQQLADKQAKLCEYDAAGLDVTKKFLRVTIQRDGWRKNAYELAGQIEELSARVAQLKEFNKHLGANLIESRNRAKRNFERGREDWKKAFFYETRGFWARLFNARYES